MPLSIAARGACAYTTRERSLTAGDAMIRKLTFVFGIFFCGVVLSGYIPQLITVQNNERLFLGLFELSLIDDVTHGVTALAALAAAVISRPLCLLFLTAFGYYYALDATFFLTYGFFNEKPYIDDILLNLPHVLISSSMLAIVHLLAPKRD
jgi:hypothetical protein